MDNQKWVQNFVFAIFVGLLIAGTVKADSTNEISDPAVVVPVVIEDQKPAWQVSVVAGGISHHLTTEYAPPEGYTEQHRVLGLEVAQAGPGWVFSAQAFHFNDSHDESSHLAAGAFGYRGMLPYQFFMYGGVGVGYIETSYYSGAIALPLFELGWWRISAQGTYLPKLPEADSGLAVQFKFKVLEW